MLAGCAVAGLLAASALADADCVAITSASELLAQLSPEGGQVHVCIGSEGQASGCVPMLDCQPARQPRASPSSVTCQLAMLIDPLLSCEIALFLVYLPLSKHRTRRLQQYPRQAQVWCGTYLVAIKVANYDNSVSHILVASPYLHADGGQSTEPQRDRIGS